MIRLLAIAPDDGWAFASSEGQIRLLRPPYDKRRHPVVPESSVDRAVAVEGFTASAEEFPDWQELFDHLEERFLAGRPPLPAALAPETVERILFYAPPASLAGLLDRIERELLPDRHWDVSSQLLSGLLAIDPPVPAELRSRARDLLLRCNRERSEAEERIVSLTYQALLAKHAETLALRATIRRLGMLR